MAGIGFELRKLLNKDSLFGLLQAYGYAGVISSGPWVLSILGVMIVGILSVNLNTQPDVVLSFLISITYLMAFSIIFGGWLQLMLTRFVSDLIYAKKQQEIIPNLLGALIITTLTSVSLALLCWPLFLKQSLFYKLLMLSNLVLLSNIWILVVMLSGLRAYKKVLAAFVIGYVLTIIFSLLLRIYGIEGLLGGFLLGQSTMLYLMLGIIVYEHSANSLISFDFLDKNKAFYSLSAISIIYNLGVWVDKFIFWFNPVTSEIIIGPLRSSIIYDPPIFLSYLSIIPGMAVFLLRMEADFVDKYDAFYNAIRNGGTLGEIRQLKKSMIDTIRSSFLEIFKVQAITVIILIYSANHILALFSISLNYRMLLSIDVVAVGVQVVLLGVFSVLFYLDKRIVVLNLAIFFLLSNFILTVISQQLGPVFYGYGFALSILLTTISGFIILNKKLIRLECDTFMLQR